MYADIRHKVACFVRCLEVLEGNVLPTLELNKILNAVRETLIQSRTMAESRGALTDQSRSKFRPYSTGRCHRYATTRLS